MSPDFHPPGLTPEVTACAGGEHSYPSASDVPGEAMSSMRSAACAQLQSPTQTQSQAPPVGLSNGQDYSRTANQAENQKSKRTSTVCFACRQSKIKCTGKQPCDSYQRRSLECEFADDGRKIIISERYLRQLQRDARGTASQSRAPKRGYSVAFDLTENANETQTLDESRMSPLPPSMEQSATITERQMWTIPFTLPTMTMRNTRGTPRGWIWLGHSSAGSFGARLTLMMTQRLHPDIPYNVPISLDGDLYKLDSISALEKGISDVKRIPPIDYSLHLFNTVRFHLCQLFRLVDEEVFITHMHELYQDAASKLANSRLWFMQFLLILAFGQAFLSQPRSRKQTEPPGAAYFTRALALMPDYTHLFKDPLLAMEVLGLVGLYLCSIDRSESAYLYVGHAIRIGQMEGLHTELPEAEIGSDALSRGYNLWWTIYVLDRHLSTSLGVPISVQDSDITTPLKSPSESSPKDSTLSLQVKISQLLSTLLDALYKAEKNTNKPFLDQTKSILNSLASQACELEEIIQLKFKNSVEGLSRGSLQLTLLYHRCVMLATRPLLLSVLRERLAKFDEPGTIARKTSALVKTIVSTGVNSATKTLQIITNLLENNLLETFLPFDLEFTMGAGILLTIANTLFPSLVEVQSFKQVAHSILDEIAAKGNKVAEVRKAELGRLEDLFQELIGREQGSECNNHKSSATVAADFATFSSQSRCENEAAAGSSVPISEATTTDFHSTIPSSASQLNFLNQEDLTFGTGSLNDLGLASYNMRSIVDQIGYNGSFTDQNLLDEWIWESTSSTQ